MCPELTDLCLDLNLNWPCKVKNQLIWLFVPFSFRALRTCSQRRKLRSIWSVRLLLLPHRLITPPPPPTPSPPPDPSPVRASWTTRTSLNCFDHFSLSGCLIPWLNNRERILMIFFPFSLRQTQQRFEFAVIGFIWTVLAWVTSFCVAASYALSASVVSFLLLCVSLMFVCVRVCACVCARACVCVCVRVSVCGWVVFLFCLPPSPFPRITVGVQISCPRVRLYCLSVCLSVCTVCLSVRLSVRQSVCGSVHLCRPFAEDTFSRARWFCNQSWLGAAWAWPGVTCGKTTGCSVARHVDKTLFSFEKLL